MAKIARSVVDTILGEAGGKTAAQRYADMTHIASVIANRAAQTRVSLQDIVSAPGQFGAYGKALPPGVEKYAALAEMAVNQVVQSGPVTSATYYSTPETQKNLPAGLKPAAQTTAHVYKDDPQARPVATAQGYVRPDPSVSAYAPSSEATSAAREAVDSLAGPVGVSTGDTVAAARNGMGLANLAGNPETVSGYSRAGLTPGIDNVLDAVSAVNPNIGVNSGYRSPTRNAKAGGAKHSQHLAGNAADLNISGLSDAQKAEALNAAVEAGARGIGLYSSGNVMHVDARENPAVWGALPNAYRGMPISMAPGWAQPALQDMFAAGPYAVTPRNAPPAPTARPDPTEAMVASIDQPRSVRTTSIAGTAPDMPDTSDIGFFGGEPGAFAGVPANSVQTTSITPDMNVASAPSSGLALSSPQKGNDASRALDAMAGDSQSFSEIAGNRVGPERAASTVTGAPSSPSASAALATSNLPGTGYSPSRASAALATTNLPDVGYTAAPASNAYATTNLPGYGPEETPVGSTAYATTNLPGMDYTPLDTAAIDAYTPAPQTVQPQVASVQKPKAVAAVPSYTQPSARPASVPSLPSGTQAGLDFHNGLNNAAIASNGNTLTRNSLGYSFNYNPSYDVTTISDPAGSVVGVRQGKVTADDADAQTSASSGLFSGVSDDPNSLGNKIGNAAVGGLGGLGGAMVGGMFGPIGGLIGSALGRNLAMKISPFAQQVTAMPGTFAVNTPSGIMQFHSAVGGLGFPDAPTGIKGALGGSQSNRSMDSMRSMSPGAASAIGRGEGGLY